LGTPDKCFVVSSIVWLALVSDVQPVLAVR
jgi:hypothetical protein